MKTPWLRPRRYRLKAATAAALRAGHPWVFRDKISSVVQQYRDGQWLELLDPHEGIVGYGIYQQEGGVAIRMLSREGRPPDTQWIRQVVSRSIKKRKALSAETDAYRLFNGENDSLPGIVLDVYAGYGVLQTYHPSVDGLGRYVAGLAYRELGLKGLVWKCPHKRLGKSRGGVRILRGQPPTRTTFREGAMQLSADLLTGQKSGTFLDLRGLRRFLSHLPLKGKRVLNLFAYTGMSGLACCEAGASAVLNVDAARPSLDFGAQHHGHKSQQWICADVFAWLKTLASTQKFDLIIVDPPCMAFNQQQVPKALATYRRLYRDVATHLAPGGRVVACCCTSRITPQQFDDMLREALPRLKISTRLPMERDHPAQYAEAEYLKIVIVD